MKRFVTAAILILHACGLSGAAELSLTEVPATDSRWFWTYDGYREPLVNRNLTGNQITVGGRGFREGICGHTPFSMIYQLDGTADSFTALAGLEDEDHPEDATYPGLSIVLVVRADRKEVFRREVFWNAPPVALDIDLRGVRQLELRAESGKGESTHRHRVAFGNPRLHTSAPEKLRETLTVARRARDADLNRNRELPALPAWKTVKAAYDPDGLLRIDNGRYEITLAPNDGGRLLRFARTGGANPLAPPLPHDPLRTLKRGWAADFGGGHFLRVLPNRDFLPGDPMLEHAPYRLTFPAEGVAVLRSAQSRVTLTVSEYRFELPPGADEMRIVNTVINCAPFPQELGVWSLTRVNREKARRIEIPGAGSADAPLRVSGDAGLLSVSTEEGNIICVPAPPGCRGTAELTTASPEARIVLLTDSGERLQIRYERQETELLQIYLSGSLLELEAPGVVRLLPPGGRISLTERWLLAE